MFVRTYIRPADESRVLVTVLERQLPMSDFVGPLMGFPEPKGELTRLSETQFKVAVRKAQGFLEKQISDEFEISRRTVSTYVTNIKLRLQVETVQEVQFIVLRTYAPELCPPYWEGNSSEQAESAEEDFS